MDLIIKDLNNSNIGKGVFAEKEFKKDEYIIEFKGHILKREDFQLRNNNLPEEDRYIQIGLNKYMGPSGGYDDLFNHSCNPNSAIIINGNKVFLKAIKNIENGEEITFDYSLTMFNDNWQMKCLCKSRNCRKIIKEFMYLPEDIKERYKKLNIIPDYLKDIN